MADAALHIGPFPATKEIIIRTFYQRCGLETTDASRLTTGRAQRFSTLQELVYNMLKASEPIHVIVNHGNPEQGLLIPFGPGALHNATGLAIDYLLGPVDEAKDGCPITFRSDIKSAAQVMGVKESVVVLLAETIAVLRKKKPLIEIRGCNVGANSGFLNGYKKLFGAARVTAPKARMFYLRILPHKPAKGKTMAALKSSTPVTARTRRRFFAVPAGASFLSSTGPICIDVRDIDGHTRVDSESFMDDPRWAMGWAMELNGDWKAVPLGSESDRFVLQVMWDNSEASYHCPLEPGYRGKLVTV